MRSGILVPETRSLRLGRPYLSHADQAEPALPGSKGWPLTVVSSSTGAGLRRAAMVKQVASAILMSWATRSGGSSLSSDSSVLIESHIVCALPARTEPSR